MDSTLDYSQQMRSRSQVHPPGGDTVCKVAQESQEQRFLGLRPSRKHYRDWPRLVRSTSQRKSRQHPSELVRPVQNQTTEGRLVQQALSNYHVMCTAGKGRRKKTLSRVPTVCFTSVSCCPSCGSPCGSPLEDSFCRCYHPC